MKKRSFGIRRAVNLVVPPQPFKCVANSDYEGAVYIWDLDKTYLRTKFESIGDLIKTAFQKAKDKATYPGAAKLLRALRTGPDGKKRPIYFVSASPPQMAEVISKKFELDDVEIDGIYFKDNLRNIRFGRLRRLREQMGYKMLALLDLRSRLPIGARECFFGDDFETDANTYSLYAQIMKEPMVGRALQELLMKQGVFRDEAIQIAWHTRNRSSREAVEAIFIHAHRNVDPRYYRRFGRSVIATTNYFENALVLHAKGHIGLNVVADIGQELLSHGPHEPSDLSRNHADLVKRGLIPKPLGETTASELMKCQIFPRAPAL